MSELTPALAELLAAVLALGEVEPTAADLDQWRPSDEEVRGRFTDVQQLLGENDPYWNWTTTEPAASLDVVPTVVNLPVTDDLVDIWRDVITAVRAVASADATDVAWELRFTCRTHWGRHATEALRALHARPPD